MRNLAQVVFAGVSLLALSTPVLAQDVSENAAAEDAGGEIVVTARRREESIQDVPISIQAVTGQQLQKLEIRQFEDVAKLVPGLNLTKQGSLSSASLRGVIFDNRASGAATAVEFYRNDAVITSAGIFQAVYDLGQVEVLRGPQGTLRGRASPSGSINVTTRRPDLSEVGGYVSGSVASRGKWNFNGAVNVPVIGDKLAIRVAGFVGENRGNGIFGLNVRTNQIDRDIYEKARAIRASVRADPLDGILMLDFNYEAISTSNRQFGQTQSFNTFAGGAASPITVTPEDRLGVASWGRTQENRIKIYNWQAVLRQFGQRLTYVGAINDLSLLGQESNDAANIFASSIPVNGVTNFGPSNVFGQRTLTATTQKTHELRLQNEERIAGMFDYVIGAFRIDGTSPTLLANASTTSINVTQLSPTQYVLNSFALSGTGRYRREQESSLFGNLTFHLGDRTEISGGLRHIWLKVDSGVRSGSFGTAAAPLNPLVNGTVIFSRCNGYSEVAGCSPTKEATIYLASLKHKFTDDIMAYGTFGTSWRPGNSLVGYGLGSNPPPVVSPFLRQFLDLADETSKSFELGLKTSWLDRRLRFNVAAFYQKFKNYPLITAGVPTVEVPTTGANAGIPRLVNASSIATTVDMSVKGIEADLSFDVTDRFNLTATLAYANSKIANGRIPCVDINDDNIQDPTNPTAQQLFDEVGANQVDTCTITGLSASNQARWQGTASAEYSHPVGFGDAFLRGFVSWKGDSGGDPTNANDAVDAYALVDLFAGVRDPDGAWELSGFVKNLFNARRVLTRGSSRLSTSISATAAAINSTNYISITTIEPREVGVSLRYSFGSR